MNDFRLNVLKPRYEELFNSCQIRSSWLAQTSSTVQKIVSLQSYYNAVERETSVPWWFVGILHYRVSDSRNAHLHNGDPLTDRTVSEPRGRPAALPANLSAYTFVESAVDALRQKSFDTAEDRSIPAWLWRFEVWSGFGYARLELNSQYLWGGTNHFGFGNNRGMFLADGKFDPNAESEQVGAATLVWYFYHKGMLNSQVFIPAPVPVPGSVPVPAPELVGVGVAPVLTPNGAAHHLDQAEASLQDIAQAIVDHAGASLPQAAPLPATSPAAVAVPPAIQILSAFRYYQKLPHQDAAIAWLHQQQSDVILKEFARRWRENPNPVATRAVTQTTKVVEVATVVTPPLPSPKLSPRTLADSAASPLAICIIAYCEDKGYQIDRGREEKNLIYVEGMNPKGELNADQFNAWNDARLVIEFDGNTPKIIGTWTATTEPGRYYTMQPINAKGVARIAFGQYKSWQIGRHGSSDPHEALVQTGGPVRVYRDLNKDGSRAGDKPDEGFFGVNHHWGGDAPNSDIGRWSAGCLVGQSRQGHREFIALCKQDPRYLKSHAYVFLATVIPGDDLFKRYPLK